MKISDLDVETRTVIHVAHIAAQLNPPRTAMVKLRKALKDWDTKHEAERSRNLIRAIFDQPDKCLCKYDSMCCPVHDPNGARD